MDHFIKLFKKKHGKDIRGDNRAVQKLRREVEKAKRTLSSQHQTRVEIESFYDGEDFSETLTRARFEELNMVSAISSHLLSCLTLLRSSHHSCVYNHYIIVYIYIYPILKSFYFSLGFFPFNNETSSTGFGRC